MEHLREAEALQGEKQKRVLWRAAAEAADSVVTAHAVIVRRHPAAINVWREWPKAVAALVQSDVAGLGDPGNRVASLPLLALLEFGLGLREFAFLLPFFLPFLATPTPIILIDDWRRIEPLLAVPEKLRCLRCCGALAPA